MQPCANISLLLISEDVSAVKTTGRPGRELDCLLGNIFRPPLEDKFDFTGPTAAITSIKLIFFSTSINTKS